MSDAKSVGVVIVAHPDDEVLWCGGWILAHPEWRWHILTLCRASDPDRAPRFRASLERLGASGAMADLDDGPDQKPLSPAEVDRTVTNLLPDIPPAALIFTHGPRGEYTRHRRHEECHRSVKRLWRAGALAASELWFFSYSDAGRTRCPQARPGASLRYSLPPEILLAKRTLITEIYGFLPDSWEATCVPAEEAFDTQEKNQ